MRFCYYKASAFTTTCNAKLEIRDKICINNLGRNLRTMRLGGETIKLYKLWTWGVFRPKLSLFCHWHMHSNRRNSRKYLKNDYYILHSAFCIPFALIHTQARHRRHFKRLRSIIIIKYTHRTELLCFFQLLRLIHTLSSSFTSFWLCVKILCIAFSSIIKKINTTRGEISPMFQKKTSIWNFCHVF